ncbi:hypothetical protein ACO2I3_16790 [Leptospira interrogans]
MNASATTSRNDDLTRHGIEQQAGIQVRFEPGATQQRFISTSQRGLDARLRGHDGNEESPRRWIRT